MIISDPSSQIINFFFFGQDVNSYIEEKKKDLSPIIGIELLEKFKTKFNISGFSSFEVEVEFMNLFMNQISVAIQLSYESPENRMKIIGDQLKVMVDATSAIKKMTEMDGETLERLTGDLELDGKNSHADGMKIIKRISEMTKD